MCKKLFLLTCFLVLSFTVVTSAEDLSPPEWRGGPTASYARWEFNNAAVDGVFLPDEYVGDDQNHIHPESLWSVEGTGTETLAGFAEWDYVLEASYEGRSGVVTDIGEIMGVINNYPRDEAKFKRIRIQATYHGGDAPYDVEIECETACAPWTGEGWNYWPYEFWLDWMLEEYGTDGFIYTDLGGGWVHVMYEIDTHIAGQEGFTLNPGAEVFFLVLMGGSLDQVIVDTVCYKGDEPPPGGVQVSNPIPGNGENHVAPSTDLSFQAPVNALCMWVDDPCDPNDTPPDPNLAGPFEYDVYFGTEPNVLTMTQLADGFTPANCNDVMVFDPCAGDLNLATTYYWRVDINDANGAGDPCFYEGPYFSLTTWGLADNIAPPDGAEEVDVYNTNLAWQGDAWADTFDVYLGTDFAEVDNGTAFIGNQGPNTYGPLALSLDTEYFWRIDEVNVVKPKGDIWSFTTDIATEIDSMDSYDAIKLIENTWLDSFSITRSHAFISRETNPPYVLDGNSMSFDYDNFGKEGGAWRGSWTEAEVANLPVGSNWTAVGGKALQIWFRGTLGNSVTSNDKMYIALDDGTTIAASVYSDINDVNIPLWQEWNIDLEDFNSAGVNLSNVSKISIGFAGQQFTGQSADGGQGTVYFDNFALFATRCVQANATGDATGDCIVNTDDLQELQWGWLEIDYEVPPEEPNWNNLLVEYKFTTAYEDTSTNGYTGIDGDGTGTAVKVASGYLSITQGVGDVYHVEVPLGADNPFDGSQDYSVSMKVRTPTDIEGAYIVFSSADEAAPNEPNNHAMSIITNAWQEGGGPSAPWFKGGWADNFWLGLSGGPDVEGSWTNWTYVAVVYDADGGTCPDDADPNVCPPGTATGLMTFYIDGIQGAEPANMDPNIPHIADDKVHIGDTLNLQFVEEDLDGMFSGNIDDFRIFSTALSHENIMWLAGKAEPTYFPLEEPSNLYPKAGPFGFDENNLDIVDFKDYAVIADHWLEGPTLWP